MTELTDAEKRAALKRAALKRKLSEGMDKLLAEQEKNNNDPSYVRGRMEQAKSTLWQLENLDNPVEGLTLDKVIGVLRNIVKWDKERLEKLADSE